MISFKPPMTSQYHEKGMISILSLLYYSSQSYCIKVNVVKYLKPNYFMKQRFYHHFYLPEVIKQVQNGHGVLSRLVSCNQHLMPFNHHWPGGNGKVTPPIYLHWDFRNFWHREFEISSLIFFLVWTGKNSSLKYQVSKIQNPS